MTFYFLPVDMVSQILNFGLPAPIDVQIVGNDLAGNRAFAERLLDRMRRVPGAVDLRIQQSFDAPRAASSTSTGPRLEQIGYTQRDVAGNLLVALSGSAQTAPTYWLDPEERRHVPGRGPDAPVPDPVLRGPRRASRSPAAAGRPPQILGNLASITRGAELATVTHYNVQPVIDIYGGVDGTDLGSVAGPIERLVARRREGAPARRRDHHARADPDDARLLPRAALRPRFRSCSSTC